MQEPLLRRVAQVAFTVDDIETATAFYRDTLGMQLLFATPTMAFFDCGGARVVLGTENVEAQRTFVYFEVADINAAARTLKERGVAFEKEPHVVARLEDREVWLALFRDPAGTLQHLIGEVPTV